MLDCFVYPRALRENVILIGKKFVPELGTRERHEGLFNAVRVTKDTWNLKPTFKIIEIIAFPVNQP